MMVEIGDQYSTNWTLSEYSRIGVGDAEVLAGAVDARTVVEATAGRRKADVGLRSRILTRSAKADWSRKRWVQAGSRQSTRSCQFVASIFAGSQFD